jgi:hypothetical protein
MSQKCVGSCTIPCCIRVCTACFCLLHRATVYTGSRLAARLDVLLYTRAASSVPRCDLCSIAAFES